MDLLTGMLSPITEHLGELIFAEVKRQFIYLCCFNSNIESLREQVQKLQNETDDLEGRVEAANRNTDNTSSVVQAWIRDSQKIQVDTNGIEDEITNFRGGCMAIKSRFLLSRKARKTADAIEAHRKLLGNITQISTPAIPASMAQVPQVPSDVFDSRKKIENEIMEDLRGGKVHMMGICGMGGVGKTTMAKSIWKQVKEEKLFEEVAMVVISQEVREFEIQREIAEKFGVTLEEVNLSARANKLHKRLTDATRKLLILDDIWGKLDLEKLGIPCKSDACTILITSRRREVLSEMNAKDFGVKILTEEEALFLFRGKIGTCAGDEGSLRVPEELVKEVVKECKGLPLALVTLGVALKDKSIEHWKDALRRLRSSNRNIPKILKDVYEPIKLSYDFLDDLDAKSLFLLCCLFPEDCNIDLELLTIYCMGLHMFTVEIKTLDEARNCAVVLVDKLKSCFLLLDGTDKNHVKMHDVVRDVAIYIASNEGCIVRKSSSIASGGEESINCKWISVAGLKIDKLPRLSLSFPRLGLLSLDNYVPHVEVNTLLEFFTIESVGFCSLKEIYIRGFNTIRSLFSPSAAKDLVNLKVLVIHNCTEMVKVIEDDKEVLSAQRPVQFPSLNKLTLDCLLKLNSFCNWSGDLQFPLLEKVEISDCPSMSSFSMGSVTTPKLKNISINGERKEGNLNIVIKPHFSEEPKEDIDEGGHTSIEESTSAKTEGVETKEIKVT